MSKTLKLEPTVTLGPIGESTDDTEAVDQGSRMSRVGRAKPWHRSRTRSILIVLWTIFTICLAVMLIVIFVQPQWLGGTNLKSGEIINFGLYRQCAESWRMCSAKLVEFNKIPSGAWKTATILVALAICSTFLSVIVMAVYWFLRSDRWGYGFRYATGFQVFTAFSLFLTCLIYPSGWDSSEVTSVCGPDSGSYKTGHCEVKWAYWIAIISLFDAIILAALSFFFIERKVVSKPTDYPARKNSLQLNGTSQPTTNNNPGDSNEETTTF
ncbi:LHFPL tetraspan subfamily member 5 protein [Exaiptasia diaphana]|uniref:Uncharacterized protein n=1 Tax=Exaiptasia diaphana TaxID=2652724 RepID=A0A913Y2G0_EXADI|nr:LHFPL tetraspan subfamily member 5 protein [Exaiptasia diaphana]KXJ22888.1 Tetraspan membrane protein of hair cell stereocilia [Exaiptasia diaphana]